MINNKNILFYLAIIFASTDVYASGPYGAPAIPGEAGQVSVSLEGEKISNKEINLDRSALYVSIGGLSLSTNLSEDDFDVDEENAGVGISYIVSDTVELFGSFSQGIQSTSSSGDSDSHTTYRIGSKFVPRQTGTLKLGFVVQMQQSNTKYDGQYQPYMGIQSATDVYYINTPVPGREKLTETIYNLGFSMGLVTPVVEPYLGVSLSKVTGTYEFSANGAADVNSYPIAGGTGTATNENVSLNYKADLITSNYFEAFLGARFKPEPNLFLNLEARLLLQKGFAFSVGYVF